MTQFTLLTFRDRKRRLLKDLQKFGDVHFRDLSRDELLETQALRQDYSQEDISRAESELDRVGFALTKLTPHAPKAGLGAKRPTLSYAEFDGYLDSYDYAGACSFVKEQDDVIAGIRSEITRLRSENEGLKAWLSLDVSPASLSELTVAKHLIGTVNKMNAESFQAALEAKYPCVYVEFLGATRDDMATLLLIDPDDYEALFTEAKDLGFSRTTLSLADKPAEIVRQNEERIRRLEQEAEACQQAIAARAPEDQPKLLIVRDCLKTILERERAAQNFLGSDSVVFIEGWVPEDDKGQFHAIVEAVCGEDFYLDVKAVDKDSETVPIKLKNNKVISAFENITAMYSLPRYNEFDPTPLMAPFYWLFFGLMVGDIGYGLVLMAGSFLALRLLDLKEGMKKFIQFFFYLSFAIILAGFLYGSLFGYAVFTPIPVLDANGVQLIAEGKPVFKSILSTDYDIVTMLIYSIVIGVVHVLFGVAVKGAKCLKQGDVAGAIFDSLFWILCVLSGIGLVVNFMAPGLLPPTVNTVCGWLFVAMLIGLAATQGRSSPSIGGKIGNGLYGVYGITSYVGDLVSYTRIVAIMLSGAYIAFSFNLMGEQIPGFMRWIFGLIIIILGQTLNFGLSLLSAYVHTCRLQYVEYFGKFYDGGGVAFAPLKISHDSVHINN